MTPQPPTLSDLLALLRAVPAPATALPFSVGEGRYDDDGEDERTLFGGDDLYLGRIGPSDPSDVDRHNRDAAYIIAVANIHPTLAAAVERWAGAVSGDREALGALARGMWSEYSKRKDSHPPTDLPEVFRCIGERLHALGAASRDEEVARLNDRLGDRDREIHYLSEGRQDEERGIIAALREELAARIESHCNDLQFASAQDIERCATIERLTAERDRARDEAFAAVHVIHGHKIEAARAEGYAAGLAAAAPPVLAAVGALHGGRVAADTLSPPAMGGEESER